MDYDIRCGQSIDSSSFPNPPGESGVGPRKIIQQTIPNRGVHDRVNLKITGQLLLEM